MVLLMKAYLGEAHGFDLQFGHWMLVGVPWALVMLFVAWLVLTKLVFRAEVSQIPGGRQMIKDELAKLGSMTTPERRVAIVFLFAIFFWVFVPFIADIPAVAEALPFLGSISDTQVAMAAAIACFLVPAQKRSVDPHGTALLRWSAAKEIPWGLLLLFGGGLSLSAMFTATGFSEWVGNQVGGLAGVPAWVVILLVAIVSLVLTELTSKHRHRRGVLPDLRRRRGGPGHGPAVHDHRRHPGGLLGLHAAGRHPVERGGLRLRRGVHQADGPRRGCLRNLVGVDHAGHVHTGAAGVPERNVSPRRHGGADRCDSMNG